MNHLQNVMEKTDPKAVDVVVLSVNPKAPYSLILQAAQKLQSSRVVISASSNMSTDEQQRKVEEAWKDLPTPHSKVSIEIVSAGQDAIQTIIFPTAIGPGGRDKYG